MLEAFKIKSIWFKSSITSLFFFLLFFSAISHASTNKCLNSWAAIAEGGTVKATGGNYAQVDPPPATPPISTAPNPFTPNTTTPTGGATPNQTLTGPKTPAPIASGSTPLNKKPGFFTDDSFDSFDSFTKIAGNFNIIGLYGRGNSDTIYKVTITGGKGPETVYALRVHKDGGANGPQSILLFKNAIERMQQLGVPTVKIVGSSLKKYSKVDNVDTGDWVLMEPIDFVTTKEGKPITLGTYVSQGGKSLPSGVTEKDVLDAMKEFSQKSAKATFRGQNVDVHYDNLALRKKAGGGIEFIVVDAAEGQGPFGYVDKADGLRDRLIHELAFQDIPNVPAENTALYTQLVEAAWKGTIQGRLQLLKKDPSLFTLSAVAEANLKYIGLDKNGDEIPPTTPVPDKAMKELEQIFPRIPPKNSTKVKPR